MQLPGLGLGRKGRHTRLSHALLGSVVESVVRRSGKPILATAESYAEVEQPLLAPDGGPAAMATLRRVCA